MNPETQQSQARQLADACTLIESINNSSGVARSLYIGFLAFTAFLVIITGTTSDLDLLLLTPVKLPIFGVAVDLRGFYLFVPWAYFFAHVNMLMTIALLSKKLEVFHTKLSMQLFETRQQLRSSLHVFAPIQFLSKQHDGILRLMLWLISRVMLVWVPPATLLWLQIDSLAMQDVTIVWSQRAALLADAVFTLLLWTGLLSGRARPLSEFRLPGSRRPTMRRNKWNSFSTAAVLSILVAISLFGATVPLGDWEQRVARWQGKTCDRNDPLTIANYPLSCGNPVNLWLFDRVGSDPGSGPLDISYGAEPASASSEDLRDCRIDLPILRHIPLCWFSGRRALSDLQYLRLTKNGLSAKQENQLLRYDELSETEANELLLDLVGVDLSNRNLRFVNLNQSMLPKVNLSGSELQGAIFTNSIIPKAIIVGSSTQYARFTGAQMSGADLSNTRANGADFSQANLKGADLRSLHKQ